MDMEPYAYWKGNPIVANTRMDLLKCNVSDKQDWNARVYAQVYENHCAMIERQTCPSPIFSHFGLEGLIVFTMSSAAQAVISPKQSQHIWHHLAMGGCCCCCSSKGVELHSSPPFYHVLGQLKSKALKWSGFGDDYIESQIKERALARKNKDFSRGDKIRSYLAAKGIALMMWALKQVGGHACQFNKNSHQGQNMQNHV